MTFYNFLSLNSTCHFCVNHIINQDSEEPFDGQTTYPYFFGSLFAFSSVANLTCDVQNAD